MTYKNKKLLELARQIPCTLCGVEDGTIVAAHSNQQKDGKGTGIKASDSMVDSLCSKCHYELDNGKDLTREERIEIWELAHRLTFRHFIENDKLVVK